MVRLRDALERCPRTWCGAPRFARSDPLVSIGIRHFGTTAGACLEVALRNALPADAQNAADDVLSSRSIASIDLAKAGPSPPRRKSLARKQLSAPTVTYTFSELRRNAILLLAAGALFGACSTCDARCSDDPESGQPHTCEGRSPQVPLQPFSFDSPIQTRRAIQVAYYAPKAIPRAQVPDSDSLDSPGWWNEPSSRTQPIVPGSRAILRNGIAYAPSDAPHRVKQAIWAVNTIRHKPYEWGGGHGSFYDSGYDCSGAVSFALHYAGALSQPLPSSDFLRYGDRGRGRWITVYSRNGHTFAVIAGLRLDTTDFRYGGDVGPRWYTEPRSTWGFSARHPVGL